MRNLKKFLALVLAMVMAMSLMVTANASGKWANSFKDEIITEAFHEAVDVLAGLGVYKGQDGGKFNATASITRAEVAALIYRIATGDVTGEKAGLYSHYAQFSDVNPNSWYAGYVGYTSNAEYIKGGDNNRFYPNEKVTGVQALAMILRTIGYDQNDEFTGIGWQVRVMEHAQVLGILKNLNTTRYNGTLNDDANREVVAELLFQAITKVPRVTWTPALGYNQKEDLTGGNYNPTQGQLIFGLYENTARERCDEWGAPIEKYEWYKGGEFTGDYTYAGPDWLIDYVDPVGHPIYDNSPDEIYSAPRKPIAVCDDSPVPTLEFWTAKKECDVAAALGIPVQDDNFTLFVNGDYDLNTKDVIDPVDSNYKIQATDTTTTVGGEGRWTRVYYGNGYKRVVMVDTMLARVTAKSPSKLDGNNHVIIPAQLEVTVYDGVAGSWNGSGKTDVLGLSASSSNRTISKRTTDATNWDEYNVGDYILLNAYTNKNWRNGNSADQESAAFQTDKIIAGSDEMGNTWTDSRLSEKLTINTGVYIVGPAKVVPGKQTVVAVNTGKHVVDGTSQDDDLTLFLDRARANTVTTFNWLYATVGVEGQPKDVTKDVLIGITDYHGTNFGVIESIYAGFETEADRTNGNVQAIASVRMADNSVKTIAIDRFVMSATTAANSLTGTATLPSSLTAPGVDTWIATGASTKTGMGGCSTVADTTLPGSSNANIIELRPMYDTTTMPPLSVGVPNPTFEPLYATTVGNLFLAPDIPSNTAAHFSNNGSTYTNYDSFGILYNHMFKFLVASDNSVVAVEVAGDASNATNTIFEGMANGNISTAATAGGKLYKASAWLTLDSTPGAAAAPNVYLNNNTKIMVRIGEFLKSTTIKVYNGVGELPGDITIPVGSQVDWADEDNDGRADYVYINVAQIPSVIDYALIYFNGYEAAWDGSTGTGYVMAHVNGSKELQRVNFNKRTQYETVAYSTSLYYGHLFALQITDGVVTDVMVKGNVDNSATGANVTDKTPYLLATWDTTGTPAWNYNKTGAYVASPATVPGGNPVGVFGNTTNNNDNSGTAADYIGNIGLSTVAAGSWATAPKFQLGVPTNVNATNPYSASSTAVYFFDWDTGDDGATELKYERVSNGYAITVYVRDSSHPTGWKSGRTPDLGVPFATFMLAPNSLIEGVEEWVNTRYNYVTMVYDSNQANAVTELYITPVPDVTPSDPGTPDAPGYTGGSLKPTGANVVNGGNNKPALLAAIGNGAVNTVVYTNGMDAQMPATSDAGDAGASGEFYDAQHYDIYGDNKLSQNLFFPFSAPDGAVPQLWITEKATGKVMYTERGGARNASTAFANGFGLGCWCFVTNFCGHTPEAGNPKSYTLTRGTEYHFIIRDMTNYSILSEGDFTIE